MSAPSDLSGKTVLITGAARRIGAALARACHDEGANLALHFRASTSDAERLRDEMNAARAGSAIAIRADLLDAAALPSLVQFTIAAFGRLDMLINNASTFFPTPVGGITTAQWDDLIGTNVRAPLFLSQAAAPELRRARGLILNMVDIHGQRPLAGHPVYSSAKAALHMLTRALARELAPEIRVNGIAPGPILWPEGGLPPAQEQSIISKTALQRVGSPDDIVRAMLYFAKDAPYVTGQILAVDGGRSI